ncbi:MAG: hypothetical protein R2864_11040 [Syntrophotaleaceae bacterium]
MVATKEVFVLFFLGGLFLRFFRVKGFLWVDWAAVLFFACHFFYFFKSSSGIFSRVVSFREGFMVVAFYAIGRLLPLSKEKMPNYFKSILLLALPVCLFGFIERFCFGGGTWRVIGSEAYMIAKFGADNPGTITLDGIPLQWFTYVGMDPVRRMVATIGDSTSLSRFLSLPVLILVYFRLFKKNSIIAGPISFSLFLVFGTSLVLSLGRGGQLISMGGIFLLYLVKYPRLTVAGGIPLVVVVFLKTALFDIQSGSAIRHMAGLVSGIASLLRNPLGHGLGASGQMAVLYGASIEEKVSESYLGSLGYQMGLPGVLAYLLFGFAALWTLFRVYRQNSYMRKEVGFDSRAILLGFSVTGGIFFTSFLSNSAIAPISAGLSLIYCGWVISAFTQDHSLGRV